MSPSQAETATAELEQELSQRIDQGAMELPLLPQVAGQLLTLVNDPRADAAKLSALIHQDQALAAHLLRIANSPAYMPRTPILSLQHAVTMLGMSLLSEIAFTASIKAGTFQVPGHEPLVKYLWHHALASGAYAKEIARLRRYNVESAYLCGLLHCIGKPVLLRTLVTIGCQRSVTVEPSVLLRLVDGYHGRVGVLIAEKWALPKQVAESIGFYLRYEQAPKFKQECALTYLADRFATYLLTPAEIEEAQLREDHVLVDLNLYPDDVDVLIAARDRIRGLVKAMNL